MECEKYFDSIDDFVEGDLDYQTSSNVNTHLSVCRECKFHYEALRRERKIYENYFEIEISTDLWTQFQSKLSAAETKHAVKPAGKFARAFNWKPDMLKHLQLTPAFAVAGLFFIFGINLGLSKFLTGNEFSKNDLKSETERKSLLAATLNSDETVKDNFEIVQGGIENFKDDRLRIKQKISESEDSDKKTIAETKIQRNAVKELNSAKQFISVKGVSTKPVGLKNKEQAPSLNAKNLESEDEGNFYSLPFVGVSDETKEELQILRVELPRSSLFALGLNLPLESGDQKVKTDLLVSSDGVARAIRLVK